MGKHDGDSETQRSEKKAKKPSYIIPIAKPILQDEVLEAALKLLTRATTTERAGKGLRLVKRGSAEVTKAIRRGFSGVVLICADAHPLDAISHLPAYCEHMKIPYGFVTPKKLVKEATGAKNPSSVLMAVCPKKAKCDDSKLAKYYSRAFEAMSV